MKDWMSWLIFLKILTYLQMFTFVAILEVWDFVKLEWPGRDLF